LDISSIIVAVAIVLVSLSVHEAAHAWTADRLGDPTARLLGRVSLNPIVHIDPIGTLLLPLLAAFSGLPIIGWAKPVPVNISHLRHPRRDFMLVAAAGPISNLLQALVAAIGLRTIIAVVSAGDGASVSASTMALDVLYAAIRINVLLALFNLIPVPPLDGGNVLAGLLPERAAELFVQLRPFGFLILCGLMFTGMLSAMILPPAIFLIGLLVP
jgi:Zn-dependent protease